MIVSPRESLEVCPACGLPSPLSSVLWLHFMWRALSVHFCIPDAIRQLIGQSLPALIQSMLTVAVMFVMMLYYSLWLTITVLVILGIMIAVTKRLGGASSRYMMLQQKSLAKEEGFVEEMMNGQKVVKVFCHEEESKEAFTALNEQLFINGEKANQYGNILMPILNNIGNIMYVLFTSMPLISA